MKQVIKRIEYGLKVLLYKGIFQALFRNKPFTETLDAQKVKRILILRRDMFGDMVITSWLFRAIQDLNPRIKIDVIASQKGEQVIRHNPRLSSIWVHNKSLFGFWKMILEARKHRYDAAICLSISGLTKDGLIANLVVRDAPKLTIKQPKKHNLYQILFNKEVETNYLYEPLWRSQKSVLDTLFGIDYPVEAIQQELYTSAQAEHRLKTFLAEHNLETGRYVVVNISARVSDRQWGRDNFIFYLQDLTSQYSDLKIVLTSVPEQQAMLAQINEAVASKNLYQCPSHFGIEEVIVLIKYALLLVSPDTATVHIAATFQVPVIVLYTLLESNVMWLPMKTEYIAVYTDKPEPIRHIPPSRVVECTRDMLNRLTMKRNSTHSV